jgi:hypothetical protein
LETLEARELLSGTPLVWTAPSTGPNTISLDVNAGKVQVWDNGVLDVNKAVSSVSSITLKADANVQNTFDIQSTPKGIATSIQFSKPSGYATVTEAVNVGNASSVQGILGTLTIQDVANLTSVTVDDSADTGKRTATLSSGSITGLAPAAIHYSPFINVTGELVVWGSSGNNNSYKITSAPGTFALVDESASDTVSVSSSSKTVIAYGMSGDTASLTGPNSGTNVFWATPTAAYLYANGYENEVIGFFKVTAHSRSGSDAAYLYGASSGINIFSATPTVAQLYGNGYDIEADDFVGVVAYSESPSNDFAYLYGASSGTNTFWASPTGAYYSGNGYNNQAEGFYSVSAYSNSASDTATLNGASSGTNCLYAYPTAVYLDGSGFSYSISASDFHQVSAFSNSASDVAYMYGDNYGPNDFWGSPGDCSMSASYYYNIAYGFNQVNAYSNAISDVAYFYSSIPYSSLSINNSGITMVAGADTIFAGNFDSAEWDYNNGYYYVQGSVGNP